MAADTFACISQYVALATGDCDVLADGVVGGRLALRTHGYAATREAAMAIASTPCSPLPDTRRRLATMRTGANYSLWMVGRQARHGGPTCVQNIPERGWGPWQEALRGRTTPIAALSERDDA